VKEETGLEYGIIYMSKYPCKMRKNMKFIDLQLNLSGPVVLDGSC